MKRAVSAAMAVGADHYFTKLFSPIALLQAVEEVMGTESDGPRRVGCSLRWRLGQEHGSAAGSIDARQVARQGRPKEDRSRCSTR